MACQESAGGYCSACLSMQSLKCLDHTLSLSLFSYLSEKIQQNGKKGGKEFGR